MPTYVVGDIQGCYSNLRELLDRVSFNQDQDKVWFAGDLVNRGPDSLKTLRFIISLGDSAVTILGNHDLHLLAVANGDKRHNRKTDTLNQILDAPDCDELLDWLRKQKLIHRDKKLGYTMLHAGIPPQWSIKKAVKYAKEVETVLAGDDFKDYLNQMYGNKPIRWSKKLAGVDRLRFITNCFSRLRYCEQDGAIDFEYKCQPGEQPDSLTPWFALEQRASKKERIIFGHWSTIGGMDFTKYNVFPVDTGCLWGGKLTAMQIDLDEPILHQVECDL